MKKIIIIITSSIMIIISILILEIFLVKNETFMITTFKKSYEIVSKVEEKDIIEILIYLSNANAIVTSKDKINKCYIIDGNNNENHINLKLINIINREYNQLIKNNNYYLFSYIFEIDFDVLSPYSVYINDASLNIILNEKNYGLNIGSFSYSKIPYYGDEKNMLSINKITPITENINGNDTLLGLGIGLRNTNKEDIIIHNISLLDYSIKASLNETKIISLEEITNKSIDQILGYKYEVQCNDILSNSLNILIEDASNIEFVLPIKYYNSYPINSFGFSINYSLKTNKDIIYTYYFDDFVYFYSNYITYKSEDIIINTYENS